MKIFFAAVEFLLCILWTHQYVLNGHKKNGGWIHLAMAAMTLFFFINHCIELGGV